MARPEITGRGIGIGHNNPPDPIDPLELIGKRDLATLLAVNPWTVDRWRRTDPEFPPPIWLNNSTPRWSRDEIGKWLSTRKRGGVSPDSKPPPKKSKHRGLA